MNEKAFLRLMEKVCNKHNIHSIHEERASIRRFANEVHEATDGELDRDFMIKIMKEFGAKKVFIKTIFIFGVGNWHPAFLRKALQEDWKWNPDKLLCNDHVEKEYEPRLIGDMDVIRKLQQCG